MTDYSWAERDDWQSAWDDLVAAVGQDFGGERVSIAADPIEASSVRRYLEPLEFDCLLHYDVEVARAHGYQNIVAPYSGLATWLSTGLWNAGDAPVWSDPSRNAQPVVRVSMISWPAPDTDSVFQTDVDHEFFQPMVVGARLAATGRKVLACVPKESRVGRGAFVTWETSVIDEAGELVALMRPTAFFFVARRHAPTERF